MNKHPQTIKEEVKKSYAAVVTGKQEDNCCEDTACCNEGVLNPMALDYSQLEGYVAEADLALGCGIPTEIAHIQEGDTVLDLGSGAGNDVFVARRIVGETGRVIGIDMTPEMIAKARQNNQKLGYKNVDFFLDEIEEMNAISPETVDVVISNCVMNLVPDKAQAYREVYRVLKEGGHFSISDIVHVGQLPEQILEAAEMYAGCVAGSSEKGAYLGFIKEAGFKDIQIKRERHIDLPDEILAQYLDGEMIKAYRDSGAGIYSVTVYAEKKAEGNCCQATATSCC